jgi:hypothetical protein
MYHTLMWPPEKSPSGMSLILNAFTASYMAALQMFIR